MKVVWSRMYLWHWCRLVLVSLSTTLS